MKNLTGKIVAPIAMLVIGLLGGLLGAFILLTAAGVSFTNSTDTGVKTAKTVYNNTTDTTKAVKKVQMPLFLSSITKKGHLQIL